MHKLLNGIYGLKNNNFKLTRILTIGRWGDKLLSIHTQSDIPQTGWTVQLTFYYLTLLLGAVLPTFGGFFFFSFFSYSMRVSVYSEKRRNICHPTRFLINFWQLYDIGFHLKLANQIARIVGYGNVHFQNENMEFDNSASHSSCILIDQLKRKPFESCQNDVNN